MSGRATKAEELEAEWLAAKVAWRRHADANGGDQDCPAAGEARRLWNELKKIHGEATGERLNLLCREEFAAEGLE